MLFKIKVRLMELGKNQVDLIPELAKRDLKVSPSELSVAINGVSQSPKSMSIVSAVNEIISAYIPQILADFLANEPKNNNLLVCPDANGRMMSESAYKRLWDSYLAELNFKFGDFSGIIIPNKESGKPETYRKPKSRFAPQKIPFVIPRITAHMLRHTFITLMYFAGVDLLTAKEQAGHNDVKTTVIVSYGHKPKQSIFDKNKDSYLLLSNCLIL